jgi:hypothetical protein
MYRLVFQGGPINRKVLASLLKTFHVGEELPAEDIVAHAVHNCGLAILRDCGITQDDICKALSEIVGKNVEEA